MVLKSKTKGKDKKQEDSPQEQAPKDTGEQQNGKDQEETGGIESLQEQLAAEKDRVLRLSAEFENYKKRKQREIDEFKKFANEMVFRQLLSVVDNLERAVKSAEENPDKDSLLEGVKLTLKEIMKLFESFHVKPVDAENQPFDPNFHQAVTQEETKEVPDNTVINVLQKGYLLHDRLIRPAMVVVSKRAEEKN